MDRFQFVFRGTVRSLLTRIVSLSKNPRYRAPQGSSAIWKARQRVGLSSSSGAHGASYKDPQSVSIRTLERIRISVLCIG